MIHIHDLSEAVCQLTIFSTVEGTIWFSRCYNNNAHNGFYATVELPTGWTVQRWGATTDEAAENLKEYINSGRFDADRNS